VVFKCCDLPTEKYIQFLIFLGTNPPTRTEYMAEVHGLFALLSTTANIPVDFIDEVNNE
jgi:hypothetical protein